MGFVVETPRAEFILNSALSKNIGEVYGEYKSINKINL